MNTGNGLNLPIVTGAALGGSGGDRPESITSDTGNRPAAPNERPMPAAPATPSPVVAAVLADDFILPMPPDRPPGDTLTDAEIVTDEEIEALHKRFDRMEALLKRRLAVSTLDKRFDNLEKWLAERF